jgi:hypothetical protein
MGVARVARGFLFACASCAASCDAGDAASPDVAPPSTAVDCDARPDPLCAHPLNRILIPKVRELGITPMHAERSEVCRRLHVDFIGRIPTAEERDACVQRGVADAADRLMGTADYARVQARAFRDADDSTLAVVTPETAVEHDEVTRSLYAGAIPYPRTPSSPRAT